MRPAGVAAAFDPWGLLDLAQRAARRAGARIAHCGKEPTAIGYKSSAMDPVSQADGIGEAAIRDIIAIERPDDGVLGEEGAERPSASGLRWVIDAVDGTVNYLHRIPHWAICVSCEVAEAGDWESVAGVVVDYPRGETFAAVRGGGAYLNGKPISVSGTIELSSALIFTEFSYNTESRLLQSAVMAKLLPQVRDIRSTGSSALDLCWTAAGRGDGFYEDELSRWDWSAGSLIVKEAGGIVSRIGTGVIATFPALHANLRAAVGRG
jgi:myo-inositol-1(or 4)-monophosphatase